MVRFVGGQPESSGFAWQGAHGQRHYNRNVPERAYHPPVIARADAISASDDNIHIACACYQAYVDKDRASIEALIADDFQFTSPLDNRIDRKTYFERCWPNSRTSRGFEFVHLAADGDCVFITYEAEDTHGKRFRNTEVMTIRNGRICEVQVFFGWDVPHKAREGGFVDGKV
jgi:ketosteroid isomerase-like protein